MTLNVSSLFPDPTGVGGDELFVISNSEAAKNGPQVVKYDSTVSGVDKTVYTVPASTVLYITSCWVSCINDTVAGNSGTAYLQVNPLGTSSRMIGLIVGNLQSAVGVEPSGAFSSDFPMPLKLEATRTVILGGNAAIMMGGFIGWTEAA